VQRLGVHGEIVRERANHRKGGGSPLVITGSSGDQGGEFTDPPQRGKTYVAREDFSLLRSPRDAARCGPKARGRIDVGIRYESTPNTRALIPDPRADSKAGCASLAPLSTVARPSRSRGHAIEHVGSVSE
jgi:hypothetical protein